MKMKDVRVIKTENEKIVNNVLGTDNDYVSFNMNEQNITDMLNKEKKSKFNQQVDDYVEKLDKHQEFLTQYAESFKDNIGTVEIKALFNRILIKPFSHNPFQRIKVENGIITDLGGMAPEHFNTDTGEMEEDKLDVLTGVVIDAGSECKYVKEGDVVFYRYGAAIPVPFFKQGLRQIAETNVLAVVNENLTQRFNEAD